jgi:DNA-binding MarR family transcriptional regulator
MKALSVLTNGSISRLSHVVSRLEQRKLVIRRPHPNDGRLTEALLTDDGYQRLVGAAPAHVHTARALVIDLLSTAQIEQLQDICATIASHFADSKAGATSDSDTP